MHSYHQACVAGVIFWCRLMAYFPSSSPLLCFNPHWKWLQRPRDEEIFLISMRLLYLHLCPGAVLPQKPCASSVPRALRSDAESVGSPGLRDPDRHAHHRGNHPPWGRERSGLRERRGGQQDSKVYFMKKRSRIKGCLDYNKGSDDNCTFPLLSYKNVHAFFTVVSIHLPLFLDQTSLITLMQVCSM